MKSTTFEVEGESYEIAYNLKRIEMYESTHDSLLMAMVQTAQGQGGGLKVSDLIDLIAYGLRKEGGAFVNPTKGREMARHLLEENGYFELLDAATQTLSRDCGFLFPKSEM